jgi:hypothetical protein
MPRPRFDAAAQAHAAAAPGRTKAPAGAGAFSMLRLAGGARRTG